MAVGRIRTIKPEFFTSPSSARASVEGRIFFAALWCWADDYGVGETNLNALLGFAFPEEDQRTREEIQSLCKEVAEAYGVVFYTVAERHFYAVPSWDKHQKTQRRAARRNPTPDDPNSVPDQRIYNPQGTSSRTQGSSEQPQGNAPSGTGEQGNRGTGEIRPPIFDVTPDRAPAGNGGGELVPLKPPRGGREVAERLNATAHSVEAHTIVREYQRHVGVPIPGDVLSGMARRIDECLAAGIGPEQIARGLAAWRESDSWSPSQIPSFVHKAGAKPTRKRGQSKPSVAAEGAVTLAEQMIAEGLTRG